MTVNNYEGAVSVIKNRAKLGLAIMGFSVMTMGTVDYVRSGKLKNNFEKFTGWVTETIMQQNADIGTNAGNIASNAENIEENAGNISKNNINDIYLDSCVTENKSGIVTLGKVVTSSIDDIADNTADVSSLKKGYGGLNDRISSLENAVYSPNAVIVVNDSVAYRLVPVSPAEYISDSTTVKTYVNAGL